MTTVALFGAGGKMGIRLTDSLKDSQFDMRYVEIAESGIEELRKRGLEVTAADAALEDADAVILAVPDRLMERIADDVVSKMKSGAMLITLDAAIPYAGRLPQRDDVAYFVTHPTHTSRLWRKGAQSLVSALIQGTDEDYALGEQIAKVMHAPVGDSYRVTLEQLQLLEPALAEALGVSLQRVVREAVEEVIRLGVPEEAAWDFANGHIGGMVGNALNPKGGGWLSDGAKLIGDWGKKRIFRDDWKSIFTREGLREQSEVIAAGKL